MNEINLQPRLETLNEKKFIGKTVKMSFAENKSSELWQAFMPRKSEVKNVVGAELYSIEIYSNTFFENFSPTAEFEKWAAVEVSDFEKLPSNFETLVAPEGLYAVFIYKGKASDAAPFYQNIFGSWLPNSDYLLDERPHFAVMSEKYKNNSDDSEEEIWIPIKKVK